MRSLLRHLVAGVFALLALTAASACSTSSPTQPTRTTPDAFPASARYMADVEKDGRTMAIGISVDGDQITAYACNGVDDEAWFFGNQAAGRIDVTSKLHDTLTASLSGADLTGDLVMNGVTYAFTAAPVTGAAGMYTAALDGARASWIVRPDGSVTGVQFDGGISGRDLEQAELQQLDAERFRSQVRNKRILQQASQTVQLKSGGLTSTINGRAVTAALVTGTTRFG